MERTAFARARGFLNYAPRAKWTAIVAAVGTAVFYVLLVLLLALFADLLFSEGRVPTYGSLNDRQREEYARVWTNLPDAERQAAVGHLGFEDFAAAPTAEQMAKWSDAEKRRYNAYLRLVHAGPVEPPLTALEQETRWRGYVWLLLRDRVSESAANSFQPPLEAGQPVPLPGPGEDYREPHGALSLVVRERYEWTGWLLGKIAAWNPWMWSPGVAGDPNLSYLTGLLIVGIVLALLRGGCMVAMNYAAARATLEAVTRLRRAVYHHTYRLGTLSVRQAGVSEASGMFTRHAEAVHDALHVWLTSVFRYPVAFVLLLVLALTLHFWLSVTFILFALLVWFLGGQLAAAFRQQSRVATRRAAGRLALLQESLKLVRLVRSYLMELFNQARVERQLTDYSKAHLARYRGEALAKPVLTLLGTVAGLALLYLAGRIVLGERLGLANLTVLIVALVSLYFPAEAWLERRKVLRRGRESAAALFEFLDRRGEVAQVVDAEFLPPMTKALEFADVSLREPGTGRMLLQNVSFAVRAGQQVGIVGPEDAEKHALIYLIPRFLDPTGGEVRIDGKNVRWVTHDSLRAQIGMVMQNALIFNDTVANNIGCGDTSYTLPQIIEAAKVAHAHQFIQKLPHGYETPIGELGYSLRPGEQFRIALARAILRDPAILIIEEPHFQLDDDTKALLDDTFDRVLPGRTVIFLPHRVSTIKHCDKLLLIRNGHLEGIGNHRELVTTNDYYKHLHYLEFNVFAEEA